MKTQQETVLSVIGADDDQSRLLVVLLQKRGQTNHIELRQQSWGEGVGWFTQSSVQVEPHQLSDLRGALGGNCGTSTRIALKRRPVKQSVKQSGQHAFPRVLRADSA